MRFLVTGCAGMIASNLCRILLDGGHEVFGLDDLSRGRRDFVDSRVYWNCFDIAQYGVGRLAAGYDGVFHCAARVGGVAHVMEDEYRNLKNAAIDWSVIEYCVQTSTPLVYLSTCCVYPPWLNYRPLAEEDSMFGPSKERGFHPDEGLYGMAKLAGEMTVQAAVREHGLDAKIVRMFNVYGPNETPDLKAHVIPALIGKVLRGELPLEVWGYGTQRRSFLYVDDACYGLIAAMEKGKSGHVYNLGTRESVTINQIAGSILSSCGHDASSIRNDPTKPTGVLARIADTAKARIELGWEPAISLASGIDRTVAWCKAWISK